jgi:pimeloyl-ACP methyl ester carboxylesterase
MKMSSESLQKKTKPGFLGWIMWSILGLFLFLIFLAVIGAVYQVVGSAADARQFHPPGKLVDAGGHKLHIYCMGEGKTTIILDHLGDGNSAEWALIQPELAKTTRACAYDRAGFGWSDPGPLPRTAGRAAVELHNALEKAGISGPYMLVGHSYGADVMELFASRYPQETAGLVLVDPGIYDTPDLPAELKEDTDSAFMKAAPVLSRVGLLRLADRFGFGITTGDLPADQAAAYRALRQKTAFWDQLLKVNESMPETSAELRAVSSLGNIPLIVLSADQPDDSYRRAWTEFNRRALSLSQQSEFRMVPGANHSSLVNQKEFAAQVAQAISDVLSWETRP